LATHSIIGVIIFDISQKRGGSFQKLKFPFLIAKKIIMSQVKSIAMPLSLLLKLSQSDYENMFIDISKAAIMMSEHFKLIGKNFF
jgi:hypothetical protein